MVRMRKQNITERLEWKSRPLATLRLLYIYIENNKQLKKIKKYSTSRYTNR